MGTDRRECPHCAELIKRRATVCPRCTKEVEPLAPLPPSKVPYLIMGLMVIVVAMCGVLTAMV